MITTGLTLVGTYIVVGACLGIGFWASRKLTNRVDEFLAKRDPEVQSMIMAL